jgi:virginiamycin B lyase
MKPALLFACLLAGPALAGGSNYGIVPGALPQVQGKVTEWPVPTPKFARDPAPGPDGNIYVAVMAGNRIARFDTKTKTFREWELPDGARPHGLLVDAEGIVWYTGNGNGTIGRLDPKTGTSLQPSRAFGRRSAHAGHRRQRASSGSPCRTASASAASTAPRAGSPSTRLRAIPTAWPSTRRAQCGSAASAPTASAASIRPPARSPTSTPAAARGRAASRRRRTACSGWRNYGNGKLVKVDPQARRIVKEYAMPAGRGGGPYAVTVDGAGRVWANEINTDTVALFDPKTEAFRVIALPSKNTGIRKAIVDAQGRFWYMGSHNGRLGVIE